MLKKWLEIIFDHRISLRERMFRVVTGICMVALFIILPMGKKPLNWLVLAVSLISISAIVKVSIPFSFFTAGGFYSGMPEWFVLCFIYISLTLIGRQKAVFFLICTAETLLCYYIAFYFPQFAAQP